MLLLESVRAHGDVATTADHAGFAAATLAIIGDAIYREAGNIRDIIDAIHFTQQLELPYVPRAVVREDHATYLALPEPSPGIRGSYLTQPHPTY